jgi:hypothetical protein
MANKEATDFVGIADCHGIESFMSIEDKGCNVSLLQVRADSNPQRHAVVYKVTLNEEQVKTVNKDLTNQNYTAVVRKFKVWSSSTTKEAIELGHPPVNLMVSNKKMWNKIPNPKLDPFG